MKKLLLALSLAVLPLTGVAQDTAVKTDVNGTVTIASPGNDVRMIFHNLFTQARKSYVLEPYTYHQLHLNLENVEFEEALQIICKLGQLKYDVQNGIYFISRDKNAKGTDALFGEKPAAVVRKGQLSKEELDKKLTTRMQKIDIRAVFADFSKQTGVMIEVDASVPAYKIDAFLINTSLRYSLDVITKAAGLKYRLTDNLTVQVYKPESAPKMLGKGA